MDNIYTNVIKCLQYRKLTVKSKLLKHDDIITTLNSDEFILILADNGHGYSVSTYLLSDNSKYADKTSGFEKLLKLMTSAPACNEIMLVNKTELNIHIIKKLRAFMAENPTIIFNVRPHIYFLTDLPTHHCSIKHEICSEEEVKEICLRAYTQPDKFPKILQSDPQAVWIGAMPGSLIRIHRPSETACVAIVYRYCV